MTEEETAIIEEAETWVGTPFRARTRIKRVGVDCVNLVAGILVEAGIIDDIDMPEYVLDHSLHSSQSQLIEWLEASPIFEPCGMPHKIGDVLCFKVGRCEHHAGLYLGRSSFIHIWQKEKAAISTLKDPTWNIRLGSTYRPTALK